MPAKNDISAGSINEIEGGRRGKEAREGKVGRELEE
jgi:hypothetical protein